MKKKNEEAAERPTSFLWFFGIEENRRRHRWRRVEKWETGFWFSTFPCGASPGGGNVKISPGLRDFQGAVGSVENLGLVFHAFHGLGISTALRRGGQAKRGATGNWVLHCRSSRSLAAFILRAHSVSLICNATRSNSAHFTPGFRKDSASASDWSFSNGVR